MARAKFSEIEDAFEFVSSNPDFEHEAFLSRETGAVYWRSDLSDDLDELPADIEDGEKYLSIPHKADLGLGKALAINFTREFLPEDLGDVRDTFGRRGAYARFKDLLDRRGMLDRWFKYESAAARDALQNWCRENNVEIDG